jgi:hypothetical protein
VTDYPIDYYYSVEAGEFVEGHVLATPEQAAQLARALTTLMAEAGYDAQIEVDIGGEYRYVMDSTSDPNAIAREILSHDSGFLGQHEPTNSNDEPARSVAASQRLPR